MQKKLQEKGFWSSPKPFSHIENYFKNIFSNFSFDFLYG